MIPDLDAIRARAGAATPGPWLTPEEAGDPYAVTVVDHEGCRVSPWANEADMVFAYKAREDIPALLAENERMRSALRTLEQWDMLTLTPEGHGAATADAPWARALIAKALGT